MSPNPALQSNPISFHLIVSQPSRCPELLQILKATMEFRRDRLRSTTATRIMISASGCVRRRPALPILTFDVDNPWEGILETSTATETADENRSTAIPQSEIKSDETARLYRRLKERSLHLQYSTAPRRARRALPDPVTRSDSMQTRPVAFPARSKSMHDDIRVCMYAAI